MTWRRKAGEGEVEDRLLDLLPTHLRLDSSAEAETLKVYAMAAVQYGETFCRRPLLAGEYEMRADRFPRDRDSPGLEIAVPPEAEIELQGVTYTAPGGEGLAIPTPRLLATDPPQIRPTAGEAWPQTLDEPGVVMATYAATYPDDALMRPAAQQAVLLMVGHWFANREAVVTGTIATQVPLGADNLLWPMRLWRDW